MIYTNIIISFAKNKKKMILVLEFMLMFILFHSLSYTTQNSIQENNEGKRHNKASKNNTSTFIYTFPSALMILF